MLHYVKPALPGSRQAEAGETRCKGSSLISELIRQRQSNYRDGREVGREPPAR